MYNRSYTPEKISELKDGEIFPKSNIPIIRWTALVAALLTFVHTNYDAVVKGESELMLDSKKVKFGEFGTFYASIRSKGADDLDKFNVTEHIKGVNMRFLPARCEGNDSVSLRRSAQFKSTAEMANAEQLNAANTAQGSGTGD